MSMLCCTLLLLFIMAFSGVASKGHKIRLARGPSRAPVLHHPSGFFGRPFFYGNLSAGQCPYFVPPGPRPPHVRAIHDLQHPKDCARAKYAVFMDHRQGLGSILHVWGSKMGVSLGLGRTMVGEECIPPNSWKGQFSNPKLCGARNCVLCYFDLMGCDPNNITRDGRDAMAVTGRFRKSVPPRWKGSLADWRMVTTDFIFRMARRFVLQHACKVRKMLFGPSGVPHNLITVHIRWSDKRTEMRLLPIQDYVHGIDLLTRKYNLTNISVLVVTEDPKAWTSFQKAMRPSWKAYHMPAPLRKTSVLDVLALLYIGLEARVYVLTGKSNWSQIYDELRRARTDYFCGNCTVMLDLSPDED